MAQNQYITAEKFEWILNDLNYTDIDERKKQDILDRAAADMEADLSRKFTVPLVARSTLLYKDAAPFALNKLQNVIRAKIREIIGFDKNRVLTGTIDSTEKFINVYGIEYKDQIKTVLDATIDYGFLLLDQAQDAQTPVQHMGLSRANNRTDPYQSDDFSRGRGEV